MAKLAFFAAVVVALVALSAAEGDNTLQLQCQRQLQESSLNACRQVVDQQLAVQLPFFAPRSTPLRIGVRMQCCQQLRDISRECRAAAIRQIVSRYEHQAVVSQREDPYYPGEEEEQQYPGEYEEQQGGSYDPRETYPQQEQGWEQQQHEQGLYRPSPSYRPQHQQQGLYRPSQQGEGSFGMAQQQKGRQGPYHLRITIWGPAQQQAQHELGEISQQQEGQGQYCGRQGQQTGFGRRPSPPRFGTEQQGRLRVVARARQIAAQLPAMCRLEGSAFSGSQY